MNKNKSIEKTKLEVRVLKNVREEIKEEIEIIEKMIKEETDKEKIKRHREKLDLLLKKYLEDL